MTSNNSISIDSGLSPADAEDVLAKLKDFASSTQGGSLGITPAPSLSKLPTQTALQLLFSTMRKIGETREFRDFVDPGTLEFCAEILGEDWRGELMGADNAGNEND